MIKINGKKIFIFPIVAIAVFAFSSGKITAQEYAPNLAVSPEKYDFRGEPGKTLEKKISIMNKGGVPMPIKLGVNNFSAAEETGNMIIDTVASGDISDSRKWFRFSENDFILDPGELKETTVQISIPQDAPLGGYYNTVLFEPQLPRHYYKEGQPRAIPVLGVLVLLSVEIEGMERIDQPFALSEFSIPEEYHLKKLEKIFQKTVGLFNKAYANSQKTLSIVESQSLPFNLRVKNNDIFHVRPSGELRISKKGKEVSYTKIPKTTILPGKVRQFPVDFQATENNLAGSKLPSFAKNIISQFLASGKYQAALAISLDDKEIKEEVSFLFFPWKIMIWPVIVIMILLILRKRVSKAIRVLFKFEVGPGEKSSKTKKKIIGKE